MTSRKIPKRRLPRSCDLSCTLRERPSDPVADLELEDMVNKTKSTDDLTLAEFRSMKSRFSQSEWAAMDAKQKTALISSARQVARFKRREPLFDTTENRDCKLISTTQTEESNKTKSQSEACQNHTRIPSAQEARTKALAEMQRIEALLRANKEAEVPISKHWAKILLSDTRRAHSPPPSLADANLSEESADSSSSSEAEDKDASLLSKRGYSVKRCLVRRRIFVDESKTLLTSDTAQVRNATTKRRSPTERKAPSKRPASISRRHSLRLLLARTAPPIRTPDIGTALLVLFDDGIKYRGIVAERIDDTSARVIFDDGDIQTITFPDPEVEFDLPESDLLLAAVAQEEIAETIPFDTSPPKAAIVHGVRSARESSNIEEQTGHTGSVIMNESAEDNDIAAQPVPLQEPTKDNDISEQQPEPASNAARNETTDNRFISEMPLSTAITDETAEDKALSESAYTEEKEALPIEEIHSKMRINQAEEEEACVVEKEEDDHSKKGKDDRHLATQLQAEEFRTLRRLRARNDAERQAEKDAEFAARLQAEEERQAARLRRLERAGRKISEPKPPPKVTRRRRDDLPPPMHVLFGNVTPSPTPATGAEMKMTSDVLLTQNDAKADSSTVPREQPIEIENHDNTRPSMQTEMEPRVELNTMAASTLDESNDKTVMIPAAVDTVGEGQKWCSVCILEDSNALLTLWCCKKRLCESCLGRLSDFGYRCFFCRASVPPRRIRAMLHHEAEWPPSRPSSLASFTPRFMKTNTTKSTPRKARSSACALDVGEEARSNLDFVGEVRTKGGLWWYSARDGETIDYIATSLRASTTHILKATRAAALGKSNIFEDATCLRAVGAVTDGMRRGQVVRLPQCDPASEAGVGSAAWIVPPRVATELLEGEMYADPEDGRVWYCAIDDQTLDSAAQMLGVDAMSPESSKLAHLASRRSGGHFSRFNNRKAKLKARTLLLAPKEIARTQMRKPCVHCRLRGDRGAHNCRIVLNHSARDYDSPSVAPSTRVRVRFLLGDDEEEQVSKNASLAAVWGWFFGTVTRVSSSTEKTVFVIYDNEDPVEDALQWPNEDVVVLTADDPSTLLKRPPPQQALEALVGQLLTRKDQEGTFAVVRAYLSLVEGFDGLAVSVAASATEPNPEEDHFLLADLSGSGFVWQQPDAARLADLLLRGLDTQALTEQLSPPQVTTVPFQRDQAGNDCGDTNNTSNCAEKDMSNQEAQPVTPGEETISPMNCDEILPDEGGNCVI